MAKKDLIGMRFGKLVVLSDSGQRGKGGNVKQLKILILVLKSV